MYLALAHEPALALSWSRKILPHLGGRGGLGLFVALHDIFGVTKGHPTVSFAELIAPPFLYLTPPFGAKYLASSWNPALPHILRPLGHTPFSGPFPTLTVGTCSLRCGDLESAVFFFQTLFVSKPRSGGRGLCPPKSPKFPFFVLQLGRSPSPNPSLDLGYFSLDG